MTISGSGFVNVHPENNDISVCGIKAKVIAADSSSATVVLPHIVTAETQAAYSLQKPSIISGTPIADIPSKASSAFDGLMTTTYGSTAQACWVGVDFGQGFKANIQQIRYSPSSAWANPASNLEGATFEVSEDGITWTTLFELNPADVHSGWSKWVAPT